MTRKAPSSTFVCVCVWLCVVVWLCGDVWLCVVVCVLCGCVCGCVVVCVCACLWLSSLTCLCLPPPLTFLLFHFVILQEPATLGPNHCEQEHAQRDSQQEVQGEDDNTHASVH